MQIFGLMDDNPHLILVPSMACVGQKHPGNPFYILQNDVHFIQWQGYDKMFGGLMTCVASPSFQKGQPGKTQLAATRSRVTAKPLQLLDE